MKTLAIILGTLALAAVIVVSGVWLGTTLVRGAWNGSQAGWPAMGPGMMGGTWDSGDLPCGQGWSGTGPGMMGRRWQQGPFGSDQGTACGRGYTAPGTGEVNSLDQARAAVEAYVERLGYTGLEVTEIMEFERNFYAIVAEKETGTGAMELLVDKGNGAVGPEPGPNMMWNAKYGMMGRGGMMGMMGGYATGEMTLSAEEAEAVTQRWLDANLPGRTAGEADPFYGYYTLHFLRDGEVEGMLSIHGRTGDVWYHSWHGDFIQMSEEH